MTEAHQPQRRKTDMEEATQAHLRNTDAIAQDHEQRMRVLERIAASLGAIPVDHESRLRAMECIAQQLQTLLTAGRQTVGELKLQVVAMDQDFGARIRKIEDSLVRGQVYAGLIGSASGILFAAVVGWFFGKH